jgi:hypothetical protein
MLNNSTFKADRIVKKIITTIVITTGVILLCVNAENINANDATVAIPKIEKENA